MEKGYVERITVDSREAIFKVLERIFFPRFVNESSSIVIIVLLFFLFFPLLISAYFFGFFEKYGFLSAFEDEAFFAIPTTSMTPTPAPFFHSELDKAFKMQTQVKSMRADFYSRSVVRTVSEIDSRVENIEAQVNGFIVGSTRAGPLMIEVDITSLATNRSVQAGIFLDLNDKMYVKGPSENAVWKERKPSRYARIYENLPLDDSTFGFNFIEAFFLPGSPLFSAVDRGTVVEGEYYKEGEKILKDFVGNLDIGYYLGYLEIYNTISEESRQNFAVVLAEAVVGVTFTVDTQTGYLDSVLIEARNLAQIEKDKIEQLRFSANYDISVLGKFSSFNEPLESMLPN